MLTYFSQWKCKIGKVRYCTVSSQFQIRHAAPSGSREVYYYLRFNASLGLFADPYSFTDNVFSFHCSWQERKEHKAFKWKCNLLPFLSFCHQERKKTHLIIRIKTSPYEGSVKKQQKTNNIQTWKVIRKVVHLENHKSLAISLQLWYFSLEY